MKDMPKLSCFVAAICRSLSEGKDGSTYFGSNLALPTHFAHAQDLGLVDDKSKLTPKGRAVGVACQHIKDGRAYVYWEEYETSAAAAVEAFGRKTIKRVRIGGG